MGFENHGGLQRNEGGLLVFYRIISVCLFYGRGRLKGFRVSHFTDPSPRETFLRPQPQPDKSLSEVLPPSLPPQHTFLP